MSLIFFTLGVAATFLSQWAYVARQRAVERRTLVELRQDKVEVPGALIARILSHSKGKP